MYIPEKRKNRQITLFDFNQSCGMELDPANEWIKLAHAIPWNRMETKYVAMFPSKTGRPATPFRMALGVLIIQKRKKLSDRAVIKEIQENPYLQYFLGKKQEDKHMNVITIPELSTQMSQDKLLTEVGTAVLAKTLDQMEAGSAGMVDMMSRSMMEQSVNPNLGGNVDIMI